MKLQNQDIKIGKTIDELVERLKIEKFYFISVLRTMTIRFIRSMIILRNLV